ncbi:MAG: hypothetical protein IKS17_02560 [Firmicutes bacterium]|nr:hypothetical protein [Bacillota bacterium]
MKRKLAALAVILCVGAGLVSGCSSSKPGAEVDASKNEDLSPMVTAENTVDDKDAAYQKFLDAQKAMEGADSVTVNSEMLIDMTYDGKTDESKQRFDIKRSLVDGKQIVDFVMNTQTKSTKEDGTEDEDAAQSQELPGYFADDTLYFVQSVSDNEEENVKLKENMTYEELMSIIGSTYILNDISAEQVATSASEQEKGVTKYIYILDNDKMAEYMMDNLSSSGIAFDEEGGVNINYANVSADITEDGILTAYTFSVDAMIKDETGEVPFSYKIASAFTDINSTDVKVKTQDELDEYITTQEYAQQLQNEQSELPEGSSGDVQSADELPAAPEETAEAETAAAQ